MGTTLGHRAAILIASLTLLACGSEPAPKASDGGAGGQSGAACAQVKVGQPAEATSAEDLTVLVKVLGGSFNVRGSVVKPASCTAQAPCPLVVVVGDRDTTPWPTFADPAALLAGNAKVVVAIFNLPGTGPGGLASQGEQDFGGPQQLTAVKDVMRVVSKRAYVNPDKTGFVALGYGLVPVTSAFKLFASSALKDVLFLIDVEGIVDRCAASQAPEQVNKSIGPDHGPGVSATACHIGSDTTLAQVYPSGDETRPSSILCAPGAWPITKTGKDCTDDWWSSREPATALQKLPVRYQRLQFAVDHRQPTTYSSRIALAAVAQSKACPYFGLNDMPPCQSPLSAETCASLPTGQQCWLAGAWGNGMAPAPYGGDAWCEITPDELFGLILPKYVQRMVDTVGFKNCH